MAPAASDPPFRSGFVPIGGRTNVGKSTLLNRILGVTVSVVTRRPQTTRNRILGVRHLEADGDHPAGQIVFVDTPGLHEPRTELNRRMVDEAWAALGDGDVVLLVAEAHRPPSPWEQEILARVGDRPVVLALNKIDLVSKPELLPAIAAHDALGDLAAIHPVCARTGSGVDALVADLRARLPEGPPYFPDDVVTDVPETFLAAEMIRAAAAVRTGQELPYAVAVRMDEWSEREGGREIVARATLLVERESQKGMLVGKGGHKIKAIGEAARQGLGRRLGCTVHLFLRVATQRQWTRDPRALDRLGYRSTDPGEDGP